MTNDQPSVCRCTANDRFTNEPSYVLEMLIMIHAWFLLQVYNFQMFFFKFQNCKHTSWRLFNSNGWIIYTNTMNSNKIHNMTPNYIISVFFVLMNDFMHCCKALQYCLYLNTKSAKKYSVRSTLIRFLDKDIWKILFKHF